MVERKIYTTKEVQEILNKTDWNLYHERVDWILQRPRCACESCPEYSNWKEWGLDLFTRDNNLARYETEIKKEDARRAGIRRAREFDSGERNSNLSLLVA